jgi:hypothetical protein
MPEIGNVMDVTIDDLSPEQQAQLKDAIDQFQQKCLMSLSRNRSGVPYLKSDMPRVLLPGELDTTSFQEKQEALNAFQEAIETTMGKHHTAFLQMFKQMMIGVFGPGMERPVLLNHLEIQELNHHCKASRSNLLYKAWGVSQSSRLYKTIEVNPFNSRTRISLHMGTWRSVRLGCRLTLLTR